MPCAMMIVGNEILAGFVLDTNSYWLCQRLRLLGYGVEKIVKIKDSLSEIAEALKYILSQDYDVIFVCGGLGPTPDDMTYEGIALGLGVPLVEYGEVLERIKKQYEDYLKHEFITSYEMSGGVRKMTLLPQGSIPLKNSVGTAPGLLIEQQGKKIFVLPGVPQELKAIFTEEIEGKVLPPKEKQHVLEIVVHAGESRLWDVLSVIDARFKNVSLGSYPHLLKKEVTLRLMGRKEDVEEAYSELKDRLKKAGIR